jgi:hypothetical protein
VLKALSQRQGLSFATVLLIGLAIRLLFVPFSTGSDNVQFAGFAKTV